MDEGKENESQPGYKQIDEKGVEPVGSGERVLAVPVLQEKPKRPSVGPLVGSLGGARRPLDRFPADPTRSRAAQTLTPAPWTRIQGHSPPNPRRLGKPPARLTAGLGRVKLPPCPPTRPSSVALRCASRAYARAPRGPADSIGPCGGSPPSSSE